MRFAVLKVNGGLLLAFADRLHSCHCPARLLIGSSFWVYRCVSVWPPGEAGCALAQTLDMMALSWLGQGLNAHYDAAEAIHSLSVLTFL